MARLGLRVEETPLAPAAAHAADAELLARAARSPGLLRVYALAGDVASLGRFHRRPAGGGGVALHRRRSGGRAAASGDGFVHVALVVPHRSALVADDPAALAPEQVLNRCVRGLLGGLEALGVPAVYPGRDLVTARGRPLAVLGLEVAADGATLVDAVVSVGRDQGLLPALLDRADPEGAVPAALALPDDVTSVLRETGRAPAIAALAAAIVDGLRARLGVECVGAGDATGGTPSPAGEDGWLDDRRVRPDLPRRVRVPSMLGVIELDLAVGASGAVADLQISGDLLAPAWTVARLEDALRGCPLEPRALEAAIARALAPPGFLLGIRSPRVLADAIAALAGQGG